MGRIAFLFYFLALIIFPANVLAQLYGVVSCRGKGVPNVVVTDGIDCVLTDGQGKYVIARNRGARFLYLSVPAGYHVQSGHSVPVFYQSINSSIDHYDFELLENKYDDNMHVFAVQADVQVTSEKDIRSYAEYLKDMKEYLMPYRKKCDVFGVDCGDMVGDSPQLFPSYIEATATVGIPFYRVIGNHDMTYGGRTFEYSYRTFESHFGPSYYSFNKGKAHYVVLNNNFYVNRDYQYIGYITEQSFLWLEQDLKYVPKEYPVFIIVHIPTSLTKKLAWNTLIQDETSNAAGLYKILEGRKSHIISGHTHFNLNICFNDNMMEHNTAALCGIWWKADICMDGTPVGYGVYEVNGTDVKWIYKSIGFPDTYQMRTYGIGKCEEYPADIVVNVWNWDESWNVEWLENGIPMGKMTQFTGYDPEAKIICSDKKKVEYSWISPIKTEHLFRATPKNPHAKIEVKVTDRFGRIYIQEVK